MVKKKEKVDDTSAPIEGADEPTKLIDEITEMGDAVAKPVGEPAVKEPVTEKAGKPPEEPKKEEGEPKKEKEPGDPKEEKPEEVGSLEDLRSKFEDALGKMDEDPVSKKVEEREGDGEEKEGKEPLNFFSAEELKSIGDEGVTAEVLNSGMTRAVEHAVNSYVNTLEKTIQGQVELHVLSSNFFRDNPDLGRLRKAVGFVAQDLRSKHPDWDLYELFGNLGKEVRSFLRMEEDKGSSNKDSPAEPAFPRGTGARHEGPAPPKGLGVELAELSIDR